MRSSLTGAFLCAILACTATETDPGPEVVARTPEDVRAEAQEVFRLLDRDADGRLVEGELVGAFIELSQDDLDEDGAVTLAELEESIGPALVSASFEARGTDLVMVGLIDGTTPARLAEALDAHPGTTRLVLERVDGSIDHEATYAAGRALRARGLETHVPADGTIASGGVDLFLAGSTRTAESGAMFGVHSWVLELLDLPLEGRDLARDHPEHEVQLAFLRELGLRDDYYWFTLHAGADDIHWMDAAELARFGFLEPPDASFVAGSEEEAEDRGNAGPLSAVAFLAGGWRSERGGIVFEECWSAPTGGLMLGWGRATKDGRLLSFEVLRLEATDDGIFYVASPGGRGATRFRLVESSEGFAAFEDPEHDDPRRVQYTLGPGGTLAARLSPELGSNAKPTLAFDFERAELVPR